MEDYNGEVFEKCHELTIVRERNEKITWDVGQSYVGCEISSELETFPCPVQVQRIEEICFYIFIISQNRFVENQWISMKINLKFDKFLWNVSKIFLLKCFHLPLIDSHKLSTHTWTHIRFLSDGKLHQRVPRPFPPRLGEGAAKNEGCWIKINTFSFSHFPPNHSNQLENAHIRFVNAKWKIGSDFL